MGNIRAMVRRHPIAFLSFLYVSARFVFLTRLPIFNDESIYLSWGLSALRAKEYIYYSLTDAKPPLLIWLFGLAQSVVPDSLVAGRLVSVCFGFAAMIGLYKVGQKLFGKKVGFVAAFSYIFTPLFLFYDRQALMESAVGAIGIWSLYCLLNLIETRSFRCAFLLGFLTGLGIWMKYNAGVFIVSAFICSIIALRRDRKSDYPWMYYSLCALGVSFLIALPLIVNGQFWKSLSTIGRYTLSPHELTGFPFITWIRNFITATDIAFWQLTPLIFALGYFGLYLFFRKGYRYKYTVYWFLLNICIILITTRNLGPRYLAPYLPFLLLPFAYVLVHLYGLRKKAGYAMAILSLLPACAMCLYLILAPQRYFNVLASLSENSQKNEYVTGWESGYAIPETIRYIENESAKGLTLVMLSPQTGNPQNALLTQFASSDRIYPLFLEPSFTAKLSRYECLTADAQILYVTRDRDLGGNERFFREVKRFSKPGNEHSIGIYKNRNDAGCLPGNTFIIKIEVGFTGQ